MDLVTIIFHHETEMKLLKLQAASLYYVQEHLIHTIYVLCHDKDPLSDGDKKNIVACYPPLLQSRVVILHSLTLDPRFTTTSWTTQQIVKLLVSRCVKSSYYLVLDSKNHFIRPVSFSDYFDPTTNLYWERIVHAKILRSRSRLLWRPMPFSIPGRRGRSLAPNHDPLLVSDT